MRLSCLALLAMLLLFSSSEAIIAPASKSISLSNENVELSESRSQINANFSVSHLNGSNYSATLFLDSSITDYEWGVFDAISDETFISQNSSLSKQISFSINGSKCSCIIWASYFENNEDHEINYDYEVIFLGDAPHPPVVTISSHSEEYVRNAMIISGEVFTADVNESYEIRLTLCRDVDFESTNCDELLETIFDPNPLGVAVPITWQWNENQFTVTLQVSENSESITDGIYYPIISVRGISLLTSHRNLESSLIDTTIPDIVIYGPEYSSEENSTSIVLEAALLNEELSPVHYSWTITNPAGEIRGPTDNEVNFRHLVLTLNESGSWQFTVTGTDGAGNRNVIMHNLTVTNDPPIANVSIGGVGVENGSTHRLPESENWTFSAEGSTDTGVDHLFLEYSWSFDGEVISTNPILIVGRDDVENIHKVVFTVTDDDGANDTVEFEVVVFGTDDDPLSQNDEYNPLGGLVDQFVMGSSTFAIFVLFLAIIGLIVALGIKRKKSTPEIPKWNEEDQN